MDLTASRLQDRYRQLDEAVRRVYRQFKLYLGPEVDDYISLGERFRDPEGYWRISFTLTFEHRRMQGWFAVKVHESEEKYLLRGGIKGEEDYDVAVMLPTKALDSEKTFSEVCGGAWEEFYDAFFEGIKEWLITQMRAEIARDMTG